MPLVSSFHSSDVNGQQLTAIMREYFALERARVYRRLFVMRFGLLAVSIGVAGIGFHWLPPLASWSSIALCLVPPVGAWIAEFRCDRRLARRLDEVPGHTLPTAVRKL